MCGRFTLTTPADVVAAFFDADAPASLRPRYNIAPTQDVICVRSTGDAREIVPLRWGLIPSWAKDPAIGARMINARSETLAEKPAFKAAFRRRRCLVAADGFYEWKRAGSRKQPYLIRRPDGAPLAFAGLWESWGSGEHGTVESCTIVTTAANSLVATVHDRMPVILARQHHERWLDPGTTDVGSLAGLLVPCAAAELTAVAVSTHVNSPRNDDPRCIEAVPIDG